MGRIEGELFCEKMGGFGGRRYGGNFQENWGFSDFFSDFGGKSLFLGQKWGLVCQLAEYGQNRQEKCVKK